MQLLVADPSRDPEALTADLIGARDLYRLANPKITSLIAKGQNERLR